MAVTLKRQPYISHTSPLLNYCIPSFSSFLLSQSRSTEEDNSMAAATAKKPHVLAVSLPAQGHLKPLMSLCRQIAKHGVKVTFVNAQSIHDKLLSAATANISDDDGMVLTSVQDGLSSDDDPNDPFVLLKTLPRTMPGTLPDLIEMINTSNPNERVSCVIADLSFGWVLDMAEKMGVEGVGFSPPSMASFDVMLRIPDLLHQGYLDSNGSLQIIDQIKVADEIPNWRKDEFPWSFPSDLHHQNSFFELAKAYKSADKAKLSLSNTCYELEPAACDLHPNFLPLGPLHLIESCSDSSNFYPEDESCLVWLNTKPPRSVVYISFGSSAVQSKEQLDELALGLEISGRPFLWVVRRDLANGLRALLPDGFPERVSELGKIVEWAPQNKVLPHPAIACFVSHCGWNSTLEGVSSGVPYLCWPYFCEQTHNESYICDKWEIGLRIECDENGVRSRYEIKKKIDSLLLNNKLKENVLKLKDLLAKSVSVGGSSCTNLKKFINHLKKCGM